MFPDECIDPDIEMSFLNFGYCIAEPVPKPDYISLDCDKILSASACICNFHPSLNGSFWINRGKEQIEYQGKLNISDDDFNAMKNTVNRLFNSNRLDIDGRFANCADALDFYNKYLYNLNGLKIIAVALEKEYKDILCDEIANGANILSTLEVTQSDGKLFGYEILGWDNGGFHSYLCNGFEKSISREYELAINEFGLIQNSYTMVKEFVKYLADKGGEPVIWLPFAIFELSNRMTDVE
jgi:hypothetical protein